MLEAVLAGLLHVLSWPTFGVLLIGVAIGILTGALPGIGGPVTLVILMPFAFAMADPFLAFALLLGAHSVQNTANSVPAILFGVPGDNAAQAILMDGHPMGRRGEAGRAMGASFTASAIGGVFGAAALALAIPVVILLIRNFGSAEMLMLALWGLTMVGVLSGSSPLKGLAMGALGMLLATVGLDPIRAIPRYAFGQMYLWDGLHLITISLGLFAIPVVIDLIVTKRLVDEGSEKTAAFIGAGQVIQGIRDAMANWFLILRNSVLGVWLGIIPGIGGSVIDWLSYGFTIQTAKDKSQFGKGDIRGIIGPDAATNSKEGGALIPTLAFGVPGSTGMAIMLGAFLGLGLTPGRQMLTENLDLTFAMVFIITIGNLLAAVVLLFAARYLARIVFMRPSVLASIILVFTVLGAYMSTRHIMDLLLLGLFSIFGYILLKTRWPRPPLLLGFVIGGVLERYLYLSFRVFGWSWITRPGVIVLFIVIVLSMIAFRKPKVKNPAMGGQAQ